MKTQEAIDHYGSIAALAAALDVTIPAIYQWGDCPPDKRQLQIERLVGLKADPGCEARLLGLPLRRKGDSKPTKAAA